MTSKPSSPAPDEIVVDGKTYYLVGTPRPITTPPNTGWLDTDRNIPISEVEWDQAALDRYSTAQYASEVIWADLMPEAGQ